YPPMPPYQSGYQTGRQVPLDVRTAVPQAQVRPLGGPGGTRSGPAGASGGPGVGGPGRPHRQVAGTGRHRRRGSGLIGSAVVVVLVAALATVGIGYATRDRGPGPGPSASGSSLPTGTAFDQFFTDDTVHGYVSPTLGDVRSCERGFAAGSPSAAPSVPGATTCTYRNGVTVAFAKAGNQSQIEVFRDTIAQFLPAAAQLTPRKGDWHGGHVDEYTGTSLNALYWDDRETTIYAFGSVNVGQLTM